MTNSRNIVRSLDYWILGVLFSAIYLLTLSVNHSEAEDSLHYVKDVTNFVMDFHPNHLLYIPVNIGIFNAVSFFGLDDDALISMQVTNIVAAITSLLIMLAVTKRLRLPRLPSLLTIVFVASTYGFWQYAVEAETYLLPMPFILMAILHFLKSIDGGARCRNAVICAVFASVAVLLHQQYVLIAITLWIALCLLHFNGKNGLSVILSSGAVMAVTIGLPYLLVANLLHDKSSLYEAVAWSRGMASDGLYTEISWKSIPKAIAGVARVLFGTDYLFGFDAFYHFTEKLFPNKQLIEERFLGMGINPMIRGLCLLLLLLSLASIVGLSRIVFYPDDDKAKVYPVRQMFVLFLALVAVITVSTTLWEPQNIEFWIPAVPFASLAFLMLLNGKSYTKFPVRLISVTLVLSVFLNNLWGSILPKTTNKYDFWYQAQKPVIDLLDDGDVIWTHGGYIGNSYLEHYNGDIKIANIDKIDVILQQLSNPAFQGDVYVSSWVKHPLPKIESASRVGARITEEGEWWLNENREAFELISSNKWQKLYRYKPSDGVEFNGNKVSTLSSAAQLRE